MKPFLVFLIFDFWLFFAGMCNGRTGGENCDFGYPPGGVPSSCGYNPGNNFLLQKPDIESLSTEYLNSGLQF